MARKKASAAADPRVTRSAAVGQAPVLRFRPHEGSTSVIQVFQTDWLPVIKLTRLFQPRTAWPRSHQDADRIKVSDFPYNWPRESTVIDSLTAAFQIVEKEIAPLLADELANFVIVNLRDELRQGFDKVSTPRDHRFYDVLASEDRVTKGLNYAFWFYMAAWWGPGHPDLGAIRNDMSALWGVEFPTDAIFYPSKISDKNQKKLYAGINLSLEPEGPGLPKGRTISRPRAASHAEASTQPEATSQAQVLSRSVIQPTDIQMKARQREIVDAIENNPVGSVLGKFAASLNPTCRNARDVGRLQTNLEVTRKELQDAKGTVAFLEESLESLQDTHHATQASLEQVQFKVNDLESDLEHVQKNNHQLDNQNTQLTERLDKLQGDLKRANKHANDLEVKLSKADDRMDALEAKLEAANERAKKGIEMSAFNHALIEPLLNENSAEEEDGEI